MLSFIRNDKVSFTDISRVYDVYNENDELMTEVVIGYDSILSKYYICYYAVNHFYEKYDYYPERDIVFWSQLINDFVFVFENVFEKLDIVKNTGVVALSDMPPLKKENLYYWIGSCYYDEDLGLPQMVDEEEYFLDELIQQECLIPMCYDYDEKYKPYDAYDFMEDYYHNEECIESVVCEIDYDKLSNVVNNIKTIYNNY